MADFKPNYLNNVVTPVGRVSYPHLVEKDTGHQFSSNAFDAGLLIPKDADVKAMKKAVLECARMNWPDVKLTDIQHPFRDGDDTPEKAGHEGCWVIKAKNKKRRPAIVDRRKNPIDAEEILGGYQCRFVVSAMTYIGTDPVIENGKRKTVAVRGVSFILDTVQLVREDETFGEGGGGALAALPDDLDDDDLGDAAVLVGDEDDDLLG